MYKIYLAYYAECIACVSVTQVIAASFDGPHVLLMRGQLHALVSLEVGVIKGSELSRMYLWSQAASIDLRETHQR